MIAMAVVGLLEIFMLVYTVINPDLYGDSITQYRAFYVALLTVAIAYIALSLFVKRDIECRYKALAIANPLCAVFMFVWALGITYFDAMKYGTVDTMVFMTFSLTVPLIFYLFPTIYAAIAIAADALMLYLTAVVSGSVAAIINLSIFFIFQLVLGICFLWVKMNLAERIAEEQENADIDALTGFANRRLYEEDIQKLEDGDIPPDLICVALDINGLKDVNDSLGHEAGDRLIIGAAQCIEQSFGEKGTLYRIGGDEFVALLHSKRDELDSLIDDFEDRMKTWSRDNDLELSISHGYVCRDEHPDETITEIAKMADMKMYAAKDRYYRESGKDRRRYVTCPA